MDTASVKPPISVLMGTTSEASDFLPLLRWLIIMCLTAVGLAALWQLSIIQVMFETERTHISSLILILFALTSLHCLVQTWFVSKELVATRTFREALRADRTRFGFGPTRFGPASQRQYDRATCGKPRCQGPCPGRAPR